ncbi:thiamine phosphate synthase [Polaribacter sp. MSW13]|uniref:Thiamine phosphate synthase n=1 Tax=Polaribacter marinus TaxID=2916838 RepID=A0A9X2AM31_9FLAO|nr:thiamine phosphate synthase [Polaribacter marinus]MCI2228524.1 thiamine phosphate synthase [Polaribacter marinus]
MVISKLHYISLGNTPKEHLENIQNACSYGAELVQLSLKGLTEEEALVLAKEVREITAYFQTRLIIKDHYKIAKEVKADGVHLGNDSTCPTKVRTYLYTWQIIGTTANTLQDCQLSISKQVDYISLGPFRRNATNHLGIEGYTSILNTLNTQTPIIGFGGITTADVPLILACGISGVAVAQEITNDFNRIKTFNQLLKASATEEQRHSF